MIWSSRLSSLVFVFVGIAALALAVAMAREDGGVAIQALTEDAVSVLMCGAIGGTILFTGVGSAFLSFGSAKVRADKRGRRHVRASLWVLAPLAIAAVFIVVTAVLSVYAVIAGTDAGDGGWTLLVALSFSVLALAILGTAVSAIVGRVWFPSISNDGTTVVVKTVGARRVYTASGVRLAPADATGVLVGGRPIAERRGLVPAVARVFLRWVKTDVTVASIRVSAAELSRLVAPLPTNGVGGGGFHAVRS